MIVIQNFDLTNHNSYRIKATCKTALFPENEQDFIDLYTQWKDNRLVILGGGYNVILSKPYYEETFVIINECFSETILNGDILEAQAGADMGALSHLAAEHSLAGLAFFVDIPSSLGGAIVMNAGCNGKEIKDVLLKVRYLDTEDLTIKEIEKKDMNFRYRNSFFQERGATVLILKAWIQLTPGNKEEILQEMKDTKASRWAKQPRDFPNAGSVFKRPPGHFVGPMIEALQLKGYTVGGARVSEKHGGFIINFNNATGEDILKIIQHVKEKVWDRFNIDLEVEQRVI